MTMHLVGPPLTWASATKDFEKEKSRLDLGAAHCRLPLSAKFHDSPSHGHIEIKLIVIIIQSVYACVLVLCLVK